MKKATASCWQFPGPALVALGLLFLPRLFPALLLELPPRSFQLLHAVLEGFSVAVSLGIFAVAALQFAAATDRRGDLLGAGFLAVGMLDLFHLLSQPGMPDFLTPSSTNKAILFWLAARILTATTFLAAGLAGAQSRPKSPAMGREAAKAAFVSVPIAVSGGLLALLSYQPGLLPAMYLPRTGLTFLKVGIEYGIAAAYGAAALLYFRNWRRTGEKIALSISGVLLLSIASEVAFTLYRNVADSYSLLGHLYKTAAFGVLLRVLVVPQAVQQARRRGRFERLRTQLTASFALTTVLGVGLVGGYGLQLYRASMRDRIQNVYARITQYLARSTETSLRESEIAVETLARTPAMQELLEANDSTSAQLLAEVHQTLAAMVDSHSCYLRATFFDDKGLVVSSASQDEEAEDAAFENDWLYIRKTIPALERGPAHASNLRFLPRRGWTLTTYAAVPNAQGSRQGVLMLTVAAEALLRTEFSHSALEPGTIALAVDSRGNYAYCHAEPPEGRRAAEWWRARDSVLAEFAEAAPGLCSGAGGELALGSGSWHLFYDPVRIDREQERYLLLAVAVPRSILDIPVNQLSSIYAAIIGVSLLLAGILGLSLSYRLTRPLEELRQGVQQVEAAQWEKRIPVTGTQEIRELAESFNRMAEKLGRLFHGMQVEYQQLFENAGESIIVHDREGKLLMANLKAARALGYNREELLRMSVWDLDSPEDAPQRPSRMSLLQKNGALTFEQEQMRKDGSRLPVEVQATMAEYQGRRVVQAFARDISDRHKARALAQELHLKWLSQKQHAETVLSSIADGVYTVEGQRVIKTWNRAAEQITGFTAQEAIGRPCRQLLKHQDESGKALCDTESCPCRQAWKADGSVATGQAFVRHKEGLPVAISYSVGTVHSQSSNQPGAVLVFRDVSKERQLVRRLQEAHRAKSNFLSAVSHELRTPLNSIIGFAQLLGKKQHGELTGQQEEFLGFIQKSGQHLLNLINDILDLSKVESGRLDVRLTTCSLPMALDETLNLLQPQFTAKQMTVLREAAPDLPLLQADSLRLRQVLYNLLSNAVKFTGPLGRVRVKAQTVRSAAGRLSKNPRLELRRPPPRTPPDGEWVLTLVEDTGIGIDPQDVERLFVPFQQLDSSSSRLHHGTGLGLALSRQLTELQGGQLWLEWSRPGQGSLFAFLLPAAGNEREPGRG